MIIYGTKGEEILIDEEDFEKVKNFNWNCYAKYPRTFSRNKAKGNKLTSISIYRLILGSEKGTIVDHINGNPLDNRKSNLRYCTVQQNSCNRAKAKNGSSKYLGVTYHKRDERWQVQVRRDKKRYYIGSYSTELEAAIAYDKAAIFYHGEFARLNFPEGQVFEETIRECTNGVCGL